MDTTATQSLVCVVFCVRLDQIALPDFSAGAMENWGLITYRETALLYDEKFSSNSNKERVASIISHELAHMACCCCFSHTQLLDPRSFIVWGKEVQGAACKNDTKCLKWVLQSKCTILERVVPARPRLKAHPCCQSMTLNRHERKTSQAQHFISDNLGCRKWPVGGVQLENSESHRPKQIQVLTREGHFKGEHTGCSIVVTISDDISWSL